jgi:hypothetical protein
MNLQVSTIHPRSSELLSVSGSRSKPYPRCPGMPSKMNLSKSAIGKPLKSNNVDRTQRMICRSNQGNEAVAGFTPFSMRAHTFEIARMLSLLAIALRQGPTLLPSLGCPDNGGCLCISYEQLTSIDPFHLSRMAGSTGAP